ncbi:hypothetical protein FQA39_LY17524 [Lamprigera yunnana]|nr:hypothetical protein FQA39_LY17524 [Lamprigera yunnana]
MQVLQIALLAFTVIFNCNGRVLEASPCPRVFVYEDTTTYFDRWYGIITVLSDSNLSGIWLRVLFDKPILQLGNWFGEVVKRTPTDYLIKNPAYNLKAYSPKIIRLFVRYNPNQSPPKLEGFRLNGKMICPEDVVTTTPTTTTEHLFTSKEENLQVTTEVTPLEFTSGQQIITTVEPIFLSHHAVQPNELCGTITVSRKSKDHDQAAYQGEFPWHVALYYTKDITIAYLCGASLISETHLITVAHCVVKGSTQKAVNSDRLVIYLGKYFLKHWAHEDTQTRYVSDVIPHPDYKFENNENDIAVLKMSRPCEFTNVVRPICLWSNDVDTEIGTVVGWGFDEAGKIEEKLMHTQMAIQPMEVCNAFISNYSLKYSRDNTYCANFLEDTHKCVGDSGGGMAFRSSTRNGGVWHLRGLVTVSVVLQRQLKCGPQQYVVFTDVSKYDSWLKETVRHQLYPSQTFDSAKNWLPPYMQLAKGFLEENEQMVKNLIESVSVFDDFLSEVDENSILTEIDPYLQGLRYEFDHWDDAIHGYRETERMHWNSDNTKIIDRVQKLAFTTNVNPLKHVHVLDLNKKGYIKPHIDSTRFCGDTIAGLSLLSDSVMRLMHNLSKQYYINVFLKRRSLYIMKGVARFEYTHEILSNNNSFFKDQVVEKNRRISIICRNTPDEN